MASPSRVKFLADNYDLLDDYKHLVEPTEREIDAMTMIIFAHKIKDLGVTPCVNVYKDLDLNDPEKDFAPLARQYLELTHFRSEAIDGGEESEVNFYIITRGGRELHSTAYLSTDAVLRLFSVIGSAGSVTERNEEVLQTAFKYGLPFVDATTILKFVIVIDDLQPLCLV